MNSPGWEWDRLKDGYESLSKLAIDGIKSQAWFLDEDYNEITAGEEQML